MALSLGAVQVAAVSFTTTTLALISLALRLWSRYIQKTPLKFNDYMAIVAMTFTAGTVSVFLAAGFAAGLGVHLQEIMATDPKLFALHLKLFVPAQLLWAAANSSVKFSILSLYTVIFPKRKFRYICYGIMTLTTAYFISVLMETFLLCRPVQYNWDKNIIGECTGENTAYLIAGITNFIIDSFIVALPMPMLFGLRMSLPKKFGIIGMFSLGALICVMSLLRILWLLNWDLADMTYTVTPGAIYSILEPTLGVVNACLPTIKPAINKMVGASTWNWTTRGYSSNNKKASSAASKDRKIPSAVNREFVRLDDDIPLTSVQAGNQSNVNVEEGGNTITVTRAWEVDNAY